MSCTDVELSNFYNEFVTSNEKSSSNDHAFLQAALDDDIADKSTAKTTVQSDECPHMFTQQVNCIETCTSCGLEINHSLSQNDEPRWFGSSDNKNRSDPSRCFFRKTDEKTIFRDLAEFELPKSILEEANLLFSVITQNKIQRGNTRKAIIFACVYNAYKNQGQPQTPDELQTKFCLSKKEVSKGLNYYNLHIGKLKKPSYISAEHVIPKIVNLFCSSSTDVDEVQKLYTQIRNKSEVVAKSTPKSTICGLVFYYCRMQKVEITSSAFANKVGLSVVTICRLGKACADILGTRGQVKLA